MTGNIQQVDKVAQAGFLRSWAIQTHKVCRVGVLGMLSPHASTLGSDNEKTRLILTDRPGCHTMMHQRSVCCYSSRTDEYIADIKFISSVIIARKVRHFGRFLGILPELHTNVSPLPRLLPPAAGVMWRHRHVTHPLDHTHSSGK